MNPANQYRKLAAELEANARAEQSPDLRAEWMHLAMGYRRLAQQADRNSLTDVAYEPGWHSSRRKDEGEAGTTA